MNTNEVAQKLVSYCREGKFESALKELYSNEIVSIEAAPQVPQIQGIQAVIEKSKGWAEMNEFHNCKVSDPIVAGNHFSVNMEVETTNRESGKRGVMNEICVYQVENGKIAREQFFYDVSNPN